MTGQLSNTPTDPAHLLQNWPEALIALDKNNCVSVISTGAKKILGEQEKAYIGKHVHDAFCVETRNFAHEKDQCPVCRNFIDCDSSKVFSTWWKNTEGNNISLDYHVMQSQHFGDIKYLISFINNNERVYNQEELDKYAEYIDKAPSPIAELDADATILFANSSMNEKLLQHGFSDSGNAIIFPENIKSLCLQCILEKNNFECIEVNVDNHTYSWNFYPLSSSSDSLLAWLSDITDKKQMEETLKNEQSAARRDFYAKMIHELRTPINAIVGFSNILLVGETEKYTDEEIDMLERIYQGGLELSDLISDTLDASKIEAGKMDIHISQFNLAELIDSVCSQLNGMLSDKPLKLLSNCDESITLKSDKYKVKQIINNLISNGIKYTKQGAVSISVSERQNRSVEIHVTDTGMGMREEELDKLFENYQRVGGTSIHNIQGTGIGLALVKELVYLLNGDIDVSSVYGEGTTFTVYLPSASE